MQTNLLFSIIIPTYNRAEFIKKTIESILKQDYDNFEIIIVDDGSKDNTEEVISAIQSDKIKYFKKENGERGAARNYGIARAKGDYITFLDSDDLLYQNHFSTALKMVEQNTNCEIFHLAYEMRNANGKLLFQQNKFPKTANKKLITGNHLSCIGVFVRQDIIKTVNFNEDRALSGTEDWELWMRLASRYTIYANITITACMINHESRSVLNIDEEKIVKRINLAFSYLEQDEEFIKTYKKDLPKMKAHLWLYVALHLVLSKNKKRGFYYLKKALSFYFPIIFNKKTLVVLAKMVLT